MELFSIRIQRTFQLVSTLLGNVGISGEQTAGSDMIHIVPLYVSGSQDAVFFV